jgi:excisionase family DNA binding protein
MSTVRVSVAEAAKILGVHPQRIHQRIREGSLPAERVGHQWAVDRDDLRRIARRAVPGRPLSTRSAWDLIAVAASNLDAEKLTPSTRSRARSRLRTLLVHTSSAELDDALAHLVHALRNRAERALFVASPRDLPDIRSDSRVHLSGVSLTEANVSAGALVEGYVSSEELDALVDDYLLSPASSTRANVIFHVAPSDNESPALAALEDAAHSPLLLAADLAEHDGVREKNEAIRSLANLGTWFHAREGGSVGEKHG